jgi:hypothetical protein
MLKSNPNLIPRRLYPYKTVQIRNSSLRVLLRKIFLRKIMNLNPIEIKGGHRWQIYHRLCELGIACTCNAYEPLIVKVETPIALVQLWSVAKHITTPRQTQIAWLETCWNCR